MIIHIKPGIKKKLTRKVTPDDTASAFGKEHMPVLATAKIVAFMEHTALTSVQEYLPQGYSSVGTQINLSHYKPVPAGKKVSCLSCLTEVEGRRLVFDISLRDHSGLIANATHTRMIINNEAFERMINRDDVN